MFSLGIVKRLLRVLWQTMVRLDTEGSRWCGVRSPSLGRVVEMVHTEGCNVDEESEGEDSGEGRGQGGGYLLEAQDIIRVDSKDIFNSLTEPNLTMRLRSRCHQSKQSMYYLAIRCALSK